MRAGIYSGMVLVILAASAGAARADLVDDCYRATVASPVSNERIIQVCTQALQVTARDKRWRVLANRAVGYMQKGDLDAAIADFNEAIALNPDPWARSSRANAFRLKGDFDRALQELNERAAFVKIIGSYPVAAI